MCIGHERYRRGLGQVFPRGVGQGIFREGILEVEAQNILRIKGQFGSLRAEKLKQFRGGELTW